jgi:hypothetical protein
VSTCYVSVSQTDRPATAGLKVPQIYTMRVESQYKAAPGSFENLAGVEGVEPANAGIKIRCLNQLGDTPTRDNCCYQQPTHQSSLETYSKARSFYQPARGCASKFLHFLIFQSLGALEKSMSCRVCANTALPEPVIRPSSCCAFSQSRD